MGPPLPHQPSPLDGLANAPLPQEPPPLPVGGLPNAPPIHPGPLPRPRSADPLAVASLACGIVSVCLACAWCVSLPVGAVGLIFAQVSKDRSGLRTAGLICSIVGTLMSLVFAGIGLLGSLTE
ncbi:MAG TPA: hypothetical protein VEB22_11755, partial [Phycisphaerales bacterium]|nr:hypothetical protein [Phycisphaerales bacterium]